MIHSSASQKLHKDENGKRNKCQPYHDIENPMPPFHNNEKRVFPSPKING